MLKYLQKVICRKTFFKISFLLVSWRSMMKIEGYGSASGSISQWHGSADPDPHQNAHGSATMLSPACLTWERSLRKGVERGRSTRRLSCRVLARKTPRLQNRLDTRPHSAESCASGAGNSPCCLHTGEAFILSFFLFYSHDSLHRYKISIIFSQFYWKKIEEKRPNNYTHNQNKFSIILSQITNY